MSKTLKLLTRLHHQFMCFAKEDRADAERLGIPEELRNWYMGRETGFTLAADALNRRIGIIKAEEESDNDPKEV